MVDLKLQLSPDHNKDIIKHLKENSGDYLEIGCFNGVLIQQLAKTFPQKNIYGIDPFISDKHTNRYDISDAKENLYNNIKDINNITFWESTTHDCLKTHKYKKLSNISCILIDGAHDFKNVMIDIEFILKIKNKHDIFIIFDDMHIGDVIKATNAFKKLFKSRIKKQWFHNEDKYPFKDIINEVIINIHKINPVFFKSFNDAGVWDNMDILQPFKKHMHNMFIIS